jgi:DNA topoisomerase IA
VVDISKFDVGSQVHGRASVREGKTVAPRPFVEGDLILIMDDIGRYADIGKEDAAVLRGKNAAGSGKAGIGTARTRGEIIKKLFDGGYFDKQSSLSGRKKAPVVVPTQQSIDLYERLLECGQAKVLVSPEMTAKWEIGLAKVERGEITPAQFMEKLYEFIVVMTKDILAVPAQGAVSTGDTKRVFKGPLKSNCEEMHNKDGNDCGKCGEGRLFTLKVKNEKSKSFGKLYVKCDNPDCDYAGDWT